LLLTKEKYSTIIRKVFVETKMLVSTLIRGEECTIEDCGAKLLLKVIALGVNELLSILLVIALVIF
jgi:hypothetical protein